MKLMKHGVALALLAAWVWQACPHRRMKKTKRIKLRSCIPTITTAISGAASMANMVSPRKTLVDGIRKEVAAEGAACCCYRVAISIPACRSPIYRMPSLIFVA